VELEAAGAALDVTGCLRLEAGIVRLQYASHLATTLLPFEPMQSARFGLLSPPQRQSL
jgi:hypothetical protein